MARSSFQTSVDAFLRRLSTPEFKKVHWEQLVAEARAARTSITYLDEQDRCIEEWPATGERRIITREELAG